MKVNRTGGGSAPSQVSTPAAFNAFQLVTGLSESFPIGTAILDNQMRYRAVSVALADINGVSVEAHLGNTVREVLGDIGEKLEPVVERVLATCKPVLKEVSGELPSENGAGHWIVNFFPVTDAGGRVARIGAIVVDVTQQRNLERTVRILSGKLLPRSTKERRRILRELHDSIIQYHAALKFALSRLARAIWQGKEDSGAEIIELMDHFPVVSLRNPAISSQVFRAIRRNRKMKRQLFGKIAQNRKAQDELFLLLAKHPEVQTKVILELAQTLPFQRRLLKMAGRQG